MSVETAVLFGRDHGSYGEVVSAPVGASAGVAISVGGDKRSPSMRFKTDLRVPNEDVVWLADDEVVAAFAVSDAHYGHESSHTLIERLAAQQQQVRGATLDELRSLIGGLSRDPQPETNSEASLLVAVLNRATGQGLGVSFADSSLVAVSADGRCRLLNSHDGHYVAAGHGAGLDRGTGFRFQVEPSDVLVMFTDGIDECHYRKPSTSVQPHHIAAVVARTGGEPEQTARQLTQLALAGVDGNPGGQDNIVVAVVLCGSATTNALDMKSRAFEF